MAIVKPEPAYRAFGTKKETYGSAIAWASAAPYLLKHEGPPIWQRPGEHTTDAAEKTGKSGITEWTIRKWLTEFTHTQRFLPHPATLFTALVLGSVSTAQQGETAAYRHDLTPQSTVELPSVTAWQKIPLGSHVFAGVGCREIRIIGEPEKFWKIEADCLGDGSMAAGVDISGGSLPTSETYLAWEDGDLLIGGTFDGADVSSGVSIKSMVRRIQLTIKNGAVLDYQLGGDGSYADALIIPNTKIEDMGVISCDIRPADLTELNYVINSTENVCELKLTGAEIESPYNMKYSVAFPVMRATEAELSEDGTIQTAPLTFTALKDDSGDDRVQVHAYGINKITEYLGAVG